MTVGRRDIVHVALDEKTICRAPELERERAIAIHDLIERSRFALLGADDSGPPYDLRLRLEENRLVLDVRSQDGVPFKELRLPMTPFQKTVKDYFTVCGSYYEAIRDAPPARIEALDMGRRGLHDEGASLLRDLLAHSVAMDHDTSRRLFTLICVLHVRA